MLNSNSIGLPAIHLFGSTVIVSFSRVPLKGKRYCDAMYQQPRQKFNFEKLKTF